MRLEDFFADIKEQALGLVEIYHQKIDWKAGQSDKKVTIAYDPNVWSRNECDSEWQEHTKKMESFILTQRSRMVTADIHCVEDSGSGFTKKHYCMAQEQPG